MTSPDLLHRGWSAAQAGRWKTGRRAASHVEALLAPLARNAGLVTLLDGAPASLSWLGGVRGQRVSPLGLDREGARITRTEGGSPGPEPDAAGDADER